ncbi:MAG: tetratricopeptide repeat protein [Pseudobdellovibrionaceae bacterium]
MKKLNDVLIISAFFSGLFSSAYAHGEKMQAATQDLVITKMERVLSTLDKSDPAWLASQQRLADLLSERARTRFMLEVENNCDGCKGSKEDRKKAIQIYESLLKDVKVNDHSAILFQLAHLYQTADQNDKAIALYEALIKDASKKNIASSIVSKAHVGLGDLLSQKSRFSEAQENYTAALKDKNLENRALTIYNLAWTEFNLENLNGAITTLENLLADPSKITKDTEEGSNYDPAFHSDVLRDLATFYSKKDITARDIDKFEKLAPEDKRKEMMLYFSKEADRIGQKKAAQEILNRYLATSSLSKEERIEASLQLAQINYDRGQTTESIAEFVKSAEALHKQGCDDSKKCEELQKSMKHYVTELHRSKKLHPDQTLLDAYIAYTKTFPTDTEMTQRGAQVALDLNNYPMAVSLYRSISESRSFSSKERQEALLNEVSAAEKSKIATLQREAYLHYLKYASRSAKTFEVKYQLAYLDYQEKNYAPAAEAFEDLAKDKSGPLDLRKKAADLSLDALAQIKKETTLEELAWDYAEIFPQHEIEFSGIARKALMNKVARVANDSHSEKSDYKKALKSLDASKIKTANAEEKLLFYTNQSILAQKVGDEKVYEESIAHLLALPGLDKAKREAIMEELTGFYEKKLDFKKAYATALLLDNSKISEKEKQFRLGTLADLAGLNPAKHYRKALSEGLPGERAFIVRSRLVLTSETPDQELKTQAQELKKKPTLLNETALLVYAKTGNTSILASILEMKELRNKSAALFVKKQALYKKIQMEKDKLASHEFNLNNDRLMQKSIEQRKKLLKEADKILAESVSYKDVTAQMMALNLVSSENERMVKDLASLPMPAGLSAKERHQYISLMKASSKPFLYTARMAQQKQHEIWEQSAAITQMVSDYKMARPEIRGLLEQELRLLQQVPGEGPMKEAVSEALHQSFASVSDLFSARQSVADEPFNIQQIEKLKILETKVGHPLMPAYLEARLNRLHEGKSL